MNPITYSIESHTYWQQFPTDQLPKDILAYIFTILANSSPFKPHFLSRTCKTWSAIVIQLCGSAPFMMSAFKSNGVPIPCFSRMPPNTAFDFEMSTACLANVISENPSPHIEVWDVTNPNWSDCHLTFFEDAYLVAISNTQSIITSLDNTCNVECIIPHPNVKSHWFSFGKIYYLMNTGKVNYYFLNDPSECNTWDENLPAESIGIFTSDDWLIIFFKDSVEQREMSSGKLITKYNTELFNKWCDLEGVTDVSKHAFIDFSRRAVRILHNHLFFISETEHHISLYALNLLNGEFFRVHKKELPNNYLNSYVEPNRFCITWHEIDIKKGIIEYYMESIDLFSKKSFTACYSTACDSASFIDFYGSNIAIFYENAEDQIKTSLKILSSKITSKDSAILFQIDDISLAEYHVFQNSILIATDAKKIYKLTFPLTKDNSTVEEMGVQNDDEIEKDREYKKMRTTY